MKKMKSIEQFKQENENLCLNKKDNKFGGNVFPPPTMMLADQHTTQLLEGYDTDCADVYIMDGGCMSTDVYD